MEDACVCVGGRGGALQLLKFKLYSRTCLKLIYNCQTVKGPGKKKRIYAQWS
jgi:hypothetical protein